MNTNQGSNASNNIKRASPDEGAIPELRKHVFTINEKDSVVKYIKTRDAIAEYCGRTWGQKMYTLVVDGIGSKPTKPAKPSTETGVKTRAQDSTSSATETVVDHYEMDRPFGPRV